MALDPAETSRYNITPGQDIIVAIYDSGPVGKMGVERKYARFGFLPSWAKPGMKPQINARGETVAEKPFFRSAFKSHRCLVPASGWYEPKVEGTKRTNYYFRRPDKKGFFFAGLYAGRNLGEGGISYSYCIITTEPSEDLAHIHPRQPVVIPEGLWHTWLNPDTKPTDLLAMLKALPPGSFEAYPVSNFANKRGSEGPECIEPEKPPQD
jgi:putative SOS response-associated peptidase YedK